MLNITRESQSICHRHGGYNMTFSKNLAVEYIPIQNLTKYKNNTKRHEEKQIAAIAASVAKFSFNNPILIDEKNEIIAGHGRFLAAVELGMSEVPTIRLSHLSEAQKRAYRIADNKLTENGRWDEDLLRFEFAELEAMELDFDLGITGFETAERDLILSPVCKKCDTKLNNIPFIKEEDIVSAEGDIWSLGKHRIICGNSLKRETFEKLLGEERAEMVFTDPPYNVKVNGHIC